MGVIHLFFESRQNSVNLRGSVFFVGAYPSEKGGEKQKYWPSFLFFTVEMEDPFE